MRLTTLLFGLIAVLPLPARAAEIPLAAHRATYDLRLAAAKSGGVQGATGSMTYEFLDACDGWATQQRLDMTITSQDGQDIHMLSDYTTFESKDGLRMRYRMKQTTDQAVTTDVQGESTLKSPGGVGEATYTLPHPATLPLPAGTLFPTAHTAALLAAAEAGKKFIALPLFDGTSEKGAEDSSVIMSPWGTTASSKQPELTPLPSGRVHIAFFDHGPAAIEPDYEVTMRYFANGVADDLLMNFGDFSMAGSLKTFALVPPKCG